MTEIMRLAGYHTLPIPQKMAGYTESSPKLSPHPIYAATLHAEELIAARESLVSGSTQIVTAPRDMT